MRQTESGSTLLSVVDPAEGHISDDQIVQMFVATCCTNVNTSRNYKRAIADFRKFLAGTSLRAVTWKEMEAYKIFLMREATAIPSSSPRQALPHSWRRSSHFINGAAISISAYSR